MFRVVTVGMPIHSVYRPVVLGKSDGVYYLSVFQDIYGRGGNSLKDIKKLLEAAGIGSLVDETRLRKVAAEQLCTPQRILGELESIEVDGKAVQTPVSPVMVSGIWMVPVQGVAEALGVVVEPLGDPFFRLRKDASTCELQSGNRIAALDGRNVQLAAAPAKLDGNLMVPLRVLLELTAATVEVDRGEAIRIRTAQMVPEPNPGAPQ